VDENPELSHVGLTPGDATGSIGIPGVLPLIPVLIQHSGDSVLAARQGTEREAAARVGYAAVG